MPVKIAPTCFTRTPTGWIEINPRFREQLGAMGLTDAPAVLELPGEVVCGHSDRHVVRVELGGEVFYLKRQHRVGWRERFRQRLAGFGWSSRSEREARLLLELEAAGFRAPAWVAYGEDGQGRAFLLLEELAGLVELRHILRNTALTQADRRELIGRVGRHTAELHAADYGTPDLTAKHVFIDPDSFAPTLIDWQNATCGKKPDMGRSLAALHASLPDELASTRERLRCLRVYRGVLQQSGRTVPRFSTLARAIAHEAILLGNRSSIRDQRQHSTAGPCQRLVWLAGEAVCAVPDVAATWPVPAIAPPFYGHEPGSTLIRICDGRDAVLVQGCSVAPLGRFRSWLRGRTWRSPGAILGRILFHLERYGVPAPRLLAFGQLFTGIMAAEWFVLYEAPAGEPLNDEPVTPVMAKRLMALLAQLHDAGCCPDFRFGMPFRWDRNRPIVGDPRGVRIVRCVTKWQRRSDRTKLLNLLGVTA
jgi:tRNA A-37 threonylcarbamoyl transferase component Bud32